MIIIVIVFYYSPNRNNYHLTFIESHARTRPLSSKNLIIIMYFYIIYSYHVFLVRIPTTGDTTKDITYSICPWINLSVDQFVRGSICPCTFCRCTFCRCTFCRINKTHKLFYPGVN